MSDIKIKCVDQTLTFVNAPVIASGGVIEDRVVFDFCPLWNGYVKTAVFYRDKTEVFYKLLEADDSCDIPAEVLASSGIVYIGVFGVKDESRRTSELLAYSIREGAVLNIAAPTVDVYAQILEALANTKIVSGRITEKGHLVFTKQDGSEVDVGSGISLTDEQVNNAFNEFIELYAEEMDYTKVNLAFITKIREMHKKGLIRFWVGTKAEYDAITHADNVFYIITDEDPLTEITQSVEQNAKDIGELINDFNDSKDELIADDNGWTVQKFSTGAFYAWQNITVNSLTTTVTVPSFMDTSFPFFFDIKIGTSYERLSKLMLMRAQLTGRQLMLECANSDNSTTISTDNYNVLLVGRWK